MNNTGNEIGDISDRANESGDMNKRRIMFGILNIGRNKVGILKNERNKNEGENNSVNRFGHTIGKRIGEMNYGRNGNSNDDIILQDFSDDEQLQTRNDGNNLPPSYSDSQKLLYKMSISDIITGNEDKINTDNSDDLFPDIKTKDSTTPINSQNNNFTTKSSRAENNDVTESGSVTKVSEI